MWSKMTTRRGDGSSRRKLVSDGEFKSRLMLRMVLIPLCVLGISLQTGCASGPRVLPAEFELDRAHIDAAAVEPPSAQHFWPSGLFKCHDCQDGLKAVPDSWIAGVVRISRFGQVQSL